VIPRLRRRIPKDARRVLPVPEGAVPAEFQAEAAAAHFHGQRGEVLPLPDAILVGAGPGSDWEQTGAACATAAGEAPRLALDARALPRPAAFALAAGAAIRAWRFDALRGKRDSGPREILLIRDDAEAAEPEWARTEAALRGQRLARELTAEPGNRLTPQEFAARLRRLEEHGIAVEVLGRKRLREIGAGALLAVGQASENPPRLVILRWKGRHRAPPVAFVGKGICFDTGGVSIKGAGGMEAMKADMAGAAACAGAILALALRRSPAPAVAVLALAENGVGAASYRPGDVLRTASGRSVEVVDTDAEGRLVLADALHVAAGLRPQAILDLATLTGACVIALGHRRAGLFGNDAALSAATAAAGEAVGEPLWPLPIGERHREDLNSDIADLRHCLPAGSGAMGGRLLPDASHAAAFLREFVGHIPWAHLDIAGVETAEDEDGLAAKGTPTGFGARLLDALVERHFEDPHRV
jgi:leucyl aminopeptidase